MLYRWCFQFSSPNRQRHSLNNSGDSFESLGTDYDGDESRISYREARRIYFLKRCRLLIIICILVGLLPVLELLRKYHEDIWEYCPNINLHNERDDRFRQQICQIPRFDLWDKTIVKYAGMESPNMTCATDHPLMQLRPLSNNSLTPMLHLTERGKRQFGSLSCSYHNIFRNEDDKTLTYGASTGIDKMPMKLPSEFFGVSCKNVSGHIIYSDVFFAMQPISKQTKRLDDDRAFSVLVIGIDSVSRNSFERFMPKSFKLLKSYSNAVIFDAYHKIGENTFPNVVPMLTGRKVELSRDDETLQLPHAGNLVDYALLRRFDEYPFIWNDYAKEGYITGYVEDFPYVGTFNLMRNGFGHQPTDYYGRPLFLAFDELKADHKKYNPGLLELNSTSETMEPRESKHYCFNGRRVYETLWDYAVRQFSALYSGMATFMFTWVVQLSHEKLTALKTADDLLHDLLKTEFDSASRKFVFILADHGQRVDSIRASFIGRIEDRLPFMAIVAPKHFQNEFPELNSVLSLNSQRLVTALDVYATFKHILALSRPTTRSKPFNDVGPSGYAHSLFTPIPQTRSCDSAGIPEWYCACHQYSELNTSSLGAHLAGVTLLNSINVQLKEAIRDGLCAPLSLKTVESFRKVEFAESVRTYTKKCRFFGLIRVVDDVQDVFDEYIVQISVLPSNGAFEATVRNYWKATAGWQVEGRIERVNRYGNQSACLSSKFERVRSMCYCGDYNLTELVLQ